MRGAFRGQYRYPIRFWIACKTLAWLCLAWLPAHAAVIEEIVVVAQKRAENVQDVPMSITALSGDALTRRGLNDLLDVARQTPSLQIPAANNMRNTAVRIRGIGSSGANPGIESSVGMFLDGIYMPSGGMAFGELIDIATVEILRGPQGTLYGRNTPVGAINITTRRPTEAFEAQIRVGAGDFDHRWVNGVIGGGLAESMAGRLSFYHRDRDGYEDNLFTGDPVNGKKEQGLRGRLEWNPNDQLRIGLIGFWADIERDCCVAEQRDADGPLGIATPGFLAASAAIGTPFRNFDDDDRKVDADDEGDDRTESVGSSVHVDYTLSSGHMLTSITGYQNWDNKVLIAADSLPQTVIISNQRQENDVFSQELRIASPGGRTIDYIAGLFYYQQDTTFYTDSQLGVGANRRFPPPPFAPICPTPGVPCGFALTDRGEQYFDQKTTSIAAFGNVTWNISERWDVTGGARVSRDEKDAFINFPNDEGASNAFSFVFPANLIGDVDRTDDSFLWTINSRYDFRDGVMGYASISTGFKSGGFNSNRVGPGVPFEFEEENSINYELGMKSVWLDRRLQFNGSLFWMVLEDFQELALNPNGTGFVVTNAGERRVRGVEIDTVAQLTDSLLVSASMTYLDAEFTDFPNGPCAVGQTPDSAGGSCNFDGKRPAFNPEWRFVLGAEWARPLNDAGMELRLRADYAWTDDEFQTAQLDRATVQESFGLLNLRAKLIAMDERWEFEVFVDNVLDENYFVQAATQPAGGLISGGGFAGARGFAGWYGPPRTWGAQFTWRLRGE